MCKYDDLDLYYSWGIDKYVNRLHEKYGFDACLINYVTMSRLYENCNIKKKIILTHDAFTYKDEILGVDDFWFMLKPNEEARGIRRCTDVLAVQEDEETLFKYYHPKGRHYAIFCRMPIKQQPLTRNNNILFIAGNNQLNFNGIRFFLDKVFPMIQEKVDFKILIAGTICKALTQYRSNSSIKLLGKIDNIEEFYRMGDIAINPIYQGTGLKIKTMEALAYGKVTIVHNHSVKGIYKASSAPLLVANDEKEYAHLMIQALTDMNFRENMSKRALAYIIEVNSYVDNEYKRMINT